MIKNLILVGVMCWAVVSYAKHPVAQESMAEAQAYKIEKPAPEHKAERAVAGAKTKKKKRVHGDEVGTEKVAPMEATDSEVRYWQYSE